MKLSFFTLPLLWSVGEVLGGKLSPSDTTTWGGDNSRTGYQTGHNMDPSVVGSAQFGQLWKALLPGKYRGYLEQIFSQALVYTLDDGIQYVFIATTQNNVYKLNAKTGAIVASRSLHVPFLTADLDGCIDINPTVGVTATGVIDPSTDTWYLTAKTYLDQTDTTKGRANGRYYYHAIDVNTLAERPNFPKDLEGTIGRNNPNRMFQGGSAHQRPALLLSGQYIYAGFASHCVQYNFTGWIIGWDKTNGKVVERFATEGGPEPNTTPGGGVWMSGGGLASDDKGSMYFSTGNGFASQLSNIPVPGRQPPSSLEEAAVNMKINEDGSLRVTDFFMPWEKQQLDGADKDLGTSPLELLQPDVFTCPNVRRMGVVTGKSGKTYILNLDNLGGYRNSPNQLDAVPQVTQNENSVYAGAGVYPLEGGYIYINVIQYPTHVFKFSCDANGDPKFTKVADSPEKNAFVLGVGHGTTTSLNGQAGTGLLWVSDVEGLQLRVYNAVPVNGLLKLIKSANLPGITKFNRPVFGDGRVYMGTTQGALYCLGSPVNLPLTCSSPIDFGPTVLNSTSAAKTIQCKANVQTQVTGIALTGNANFQISGKPTLPVTVAAGSNISFQAVFAPNQPGPLSSDIQIASTNNVAGYSTSTPVTLKGVGDSLDPLLAISPNTISFDGVITGQQAGGVSQSIIFYNQGDGPLNIQGLDYSTVSESGALVQPVNSANGPQVGPFTFQDIPTTIAKGSQAVININFDPSTSGNYAVYVHVRTNGGTKVFDVAGTAGSYPKALLEFQAADGSGAWIPYVNNNPFTFGDVVEQNTKSLKMRLTNNGGKDAASLSVTVSKPPFGVAGILGAVNGVDIGEGTILSAGESATATLFCSVPKSQVNVDSYNGTVQWTLNTGDPTFGKQFIQFTCNAISEQVGPVAANGSATYRYAGCFKENNPGRQLKTQIYGAADSTNGKCINACAAQNYIYAGTQYHSECWCGNTIPNQQTSEDDCNFNCAGDLTQTCGGNGIRHDGTFISLFSNGGVVNPGSPTTPTTPPTGPVVVQSVGPYVYSACYSEGANGRALGAKAFAGNDMTIEKCAANCAAYTYFGTEYSSECYCANAISSLKAAEGDCSSACAGNSSEICGAGNRLSVYVLRSAAASSSSLSSTASSSTTASTSATASSATPSPTGPIAVPIAGKFSFSGCYTEASDGRALSDTATFDDLMTVEKCATFCDGYQYMGVEFARECYCGNSINFGSVKTDSGCSMICGGNPNEYCGGPGVLDFYQVKTSTSTSGTSATSTSTSSAAPTPTGPIIVQGDANFQYAACYVEPATGRALPNLVLANEQMTVETCLAACSQYAYAGLEYARECWCGNTLASGATKATLDSQCSTRCAGNPFEYCGAGGKLTLYTRRPAGLSSSAAAASSSTSVSSSSAPASSSSTSASSSGTSSSSVSSSTSSGFVTSIKPTTSDSSTSVSVPSSSSSTTTSASSTSSSTLSSSSVTSTSSSSSSSTTSSATSSSSSSSTTSSVTSSSSSSSTTSSATSSSSSSSTTSPVTSSSSSSSTTSSATSSSSSSSTTNSATSSSSSPSSATNSATSTSPSSQTSSSATSSSSSQSSSTSSTTSRTSSSSSSTPSSSSSSSTPSSSSSSSTLSSSSSSSTLSSSSPSSTSSTTSSTSRSSSSTPSSSSPSSTSSTTSSTSSSKTSSIPSSQTSSSTSSSSSQSSSSSTRTTATSTRLAPTPGQTINSYVYLGCANQTSPYALSGYFKTDTKKMTTESCQALCLKNNYGIAATENGDTCYCGNGLQSYSALGQTSCNTPCAGNSSEVCGGIDSSNKKYLSVWNSTSTTIPPTDVKQVGAYPRLSCFTDTGTTHAIKAVNYTSTTKMSAESCVGYCIANNYAYAGISNGRSCYCDSVIAPAAKRQDWDKCNVLCSGNSREFCGAAQSLLVYKLDPTSVDANGKPITMNRDNSAIIQPNTTTSA